MQITVVAVMWPHDRSLRSGVRRYFTGSCLPGRHRHQGRYADAVLHAFATCAGRLERAVHLPRRAMVDQPDQVRAGRLPA